MLDPTLPRVGAVIASDIDEFALCVALCEQALQEALDGASDPVYEGRARQILAHIYGEQGDIPAARRQLDAAMQLRTERAEEGLREFCLVSKALVDEMTADLDAAAAAAMEVVNSKFGAAGWTGPTRPVRPQRGHARSWRRRPGTFVAHRGARALRVVGRDEGRP